MTIAKEAFYTLAVIAVISGLFEILSSSGKLKKYTNFALSLIILLSVMLPLSSVINEFPLVNATYFVNENDNTFSYGPAISSLETAVEKHISETLSIPPNCFEVKLTLSNENEISSATVTLKDTYYNRYTDRIKVVSEDLFGFPVNVIPKNKE